LAAIELSPTRRTPHKNAAPPKACANAVIARPGPPLARAGAYYFDGWAQPLDHPTLQGLVSSAYDDRQPLSGWRDYTAASMRLQLGWAAASGIRFFVFDWYHLPANAPNPLLNHALGVYRSLSDHRDVGYAITYINSPSPTNFVVPPREWPAVVRRWVSYFMSPDYVRVAGKPLFLINDVAGFTSQLGGPAGVNAALATLRRAARARGLPGVFVAGAVDVNTGFDWRSLPTFAAESFDAFTQYGSPAAAGFLHGQQPYDRLVRAIEANWRRFAAGGKPFIPSVTVGWDPRPWNEKIAGALWWFPRTPAGVGAFARDAVRFARQHPVPPPPAKPLVLLEAWNELGEGAYLIPTTGACHAYGNAVARALARG
jgi:Glycosyltransferase WbsX